MPSMDGFASKIGKEFGSQGNAAGKAFGDSMTVGIDGGAKKSSGILTGLGTVAKGVATAAMAGFTALTGAVTAIGGAALSAYADYEQLVGGVDTLFGSASQTLQGYAAEAYKTCGMSANQYMTQATSFAASLVSSCSGDVAKAADYANMAMGDMSDNVNKMGSDMTDVQNAYQGFAKQNYTMLDNLKLGYGGTQAEMKRLIADANKLRQEQGKNADLTIDSYADVVEAIHTVQENMGITGTTAKEAATTISGSIGMAKAAWENFITGLGRDDVDFSQLTQQLLESIGAVATNVAPRVAQIGQGIITAFPVVLSGLGTVLAPIVSEALSTAWNIAINALAGIGIHLPSVDSSQMLSGINAAMDAAKLLLTDPAAFLEKGNQLVQSVGSGIRAGVPKIVSEGLNVLTSLSQAFLTGFPQIVSMGGQLVLSLVQGLMDSLPSLIEQGPQIVSNIANGISAAAGVLLDTGLQIIVAIGTGLVNAVPTLLANIPQILQAVWDAFVAYQWVTLGGTLVTSIGEGIAALGSQIPTKLKGFFDQAVNHAGEFISNMAAKGLQAGSDFLLNIAATLSQMPGRVAGWFSEIIFNAASLVSSLGAKASAAGQGFLSGIQGGFNAAVSFVASIPGRVVGAIGDLGGLLVNSGRSLINGFVSGIQSAIGGALSTVSGAVSQIRSFFPFSPAKRGPFSGHGYTTYSGKALMEGWAEGIGSGTGAVNSAITSALASASSLIGSGITVAPSVAVAGADAAGATYNVTVNGGSVNADQRIMQAVDVLVSAAKRSAGSGR
jgi:phage-related protein